MVAANPGIVAREGFVSGFQEVSKVCSQVVSDSGALQKIFKLALRIIETLGLLLGIELAPIFSRYLNNGIEAIDAFQIFPDGYALLTTELKPKNALDIGTNAAFFTADVGGLVLLADDLARTAAGVGSTPFLGETARFALGTALNGIVGVGYGLMLAKAGWDLSRAEEVPEASRTKFMARAIIDIVRCVVEIAAKFFAIFGSAILIAMGLAAVAPTALLVAPIVLGLIGASLGIASFVVGLYIPKEDLLN